MWLISSSAWGPTKVGRRGTVVDLVRGEFCYSLKFLAKRWLWARTRVERFLIMLKNADMIVCRNRDDERDDISVYSINNYNKFQFSGSQKRGNVQDDTGTTPGRHRDQEEEFKNSRTKESTPSLRSGGAAKRKTGIPESFPFQADIQAAVKFWTEQGRTDLCATVVMEAAQFRDRCVGDGVTALDWSAKWRTWYRNTMRFNKQQRSSGRKESQHEQRARIIAEDHASESQYRDPPPDQSEGNRLGVVLPYRVNDGR